MTKHEVYFAAMKARDHRFDGKFFVGVKTTGIYCRPICPAQPKLQNVEFFSNHVAAERSGYRPCLRCRPESAPLSPAWMGTTAVVQRAIKLIHNSTALHFKEDHFAKKFGVSARHLRRLFLDEIGKTPKQLSHENRLNLSRKLLSETALPVSEVAWASGFHSIRRFNDAFKERFKRSPTQLRRHKDTSPESIRISLPYRPPFDFEGLISSYKSHQIGELEWFEDEKMFRLVHFANQTGVIAISNDANRSCLWLEINIADTSQIHLIIARVRSLFDLDSDPLLISNCMDSHPALKKLLKKHPGIRLPSGWDGFEIAVSTILGQLVSVEFGRKLVHDLIELAGQDSGFKKEGKSIKLFPTPIQLAQADLGRLKTTGRRKTTLKNFAKAVATGQISLEAEQDVDQFIKSAMAIEGIGPWTAHYMALKILRHTDAFPKTDLILARALELHKEIDFESVSPWKGYVAALFWREYTQTLKKAGRKKK